MKFAAAEKLAIVPSGARTKLSMGLPPRQYDLALDMTRLDRVVAYDPADLTLGVEPGIPLQKLAAVLAEHKQWLPLAVPYMDRTTVGGAIASGVDTRAAADVRHGARLRSRDGIRHWRRASRRKAADAW